MGYFLIKIVLLSVLIYLLSNLCINKHDIRYCIPIGI